MIFLAPGASGNVASLAPQLEGLRARGLQAVGVEVPKGNAERALPAYRAALGDVPPSEAIVGGHSYGGRVASLLAAQEAAAGLVLLSYPLHAPGRSDRWEERTAHWPRISCPVLLLSGESDPLARIGLLREAVKRLPNAELVTYPAVGHGIGLVLEDALDRIAGFVSRVAAGLGG